jgi:amino acid transporter
MMGLSGAIGFEIFVLMDGAYFNILAPVQAGPSIILALLIAGLINMLTMFSYCELSAAMPEVGGEYTYIKTAYGGYISFVSGSFRWLASVFAAALAAVFLTRQLEYLCTLIFPGCQILPSYQMLITAVVIVIFTLLEIRGLKKLGSILVIAFLAIFAFFIIAGSSYGLPPSEILPKNLVEDLPRMLSASVYVFSMFFGMRALVAHASLVKKPERNVPRGIIISTLLIIPLYISLAYVAGGIVLPNEQVARTFPEPFRFLHFAATVTMGRAGGVLIAIGGIVASSSALSTSITVQSSISRGMSRDKYLPEMLLRLHSVFNTPYIAIIIGSFFIIILSTLSNISFLVYGTSLATLIVFAFVNLSLLKLRRDKPYMERPFKTPLYPLTPILGFVMSIALLVFPIIIGETNALDAVLSGIGLTTITMMIYYLRMVGRHRIQIAVGGAGLGVGISLSLLALLGELGFMSPIFPFIPNHILLVISLVSVVGGILNVTVSSYN